MCGGDEPDAPPPSPYETEMMNQAENRLKEYQDTFIPLENQWMQQSKLYGSQDYTTKQQNAAVAASRMQNSGTALAGVGMQPGGTFLGAAQGAAQGGGGAAGLASAAGYQVAKDKKYGSALDIVKLGRNQTATSANMNSQLASSQAGIQAAQHAAARQEQSAMAGAMGTAIGMGGMAAYNKWGGGATGGSTG